MTTVFRTKSDSGFRNWDHGPEADWTQQRYKVTTALVGYGRSSIPVYVLYAPHDAQPIFLPEVLTPDITVDILTRHLRKEASP